MTRISRFGTVGLIVWMMALALPGAADGQRRAVPRHPTHPIRPALVRGQVFIGGYYYDPFFGPYPWWPRRAYPYWYVPVYDNRADVRIQVVPDDLDDAAVYADGFYAGIVNEFDGVLQSLPLTPGGHTIVLYREGYRTVRRNIYLSPGSTFRIRETMERLPAGVKSELPELAPPVPRPPAGSYTTPARPSKIEAPRAAEGPAPAAGLARLDLFVQPANAEVLIDGQPWASSEEGHYVFELPAGKHRLEIRRPGYRSFVADFEVRDGETKPLNVSLIASTS